MHMPAGQLIKHHRMARCDNNIQIRWQRRDMIIADRCLEATFSLAGEEKAECIEGVEVFRYLGQLLERLDVINNPIDVRTCYSLTAMFS